MDIICSKQGKALVMTLKGRMDRIAALEFDKVFAEWREKGEMLFVVDMQDLGYISSAGLRSLLAANQQLKDNNGQIRLCNLGGLVKEVFVISGFDSLFPLYASPAEATKFNQK